jgi:CheY-like chemotaxis protein
MTTSNKITILLVEDNPINIVVIKKFLESLYQVDTITSGKKLSSVLAKTDYKLILTDINLGDEDMNGVDVLKQIRNNPKTANLPVIAVTAYSLTDDVERFKEHGFTDFVPKPINRILLLETIQKYIV